MKGSVCRSAVSATQVLCVQADEVNVQEPIERAKLRSCVAISNDRHTSVAGKAYVTLGQCGFGPAPVFWNGALGGCWLLQAQGAVSAETVSRGVSPSGPGVGRLGPHGRRRRRVAGHRPILPVPLEAAGGDRPRPQTRPEQNRVRATGRGRTPDQGSGRGSQDPAQGRCRRGGGGAPKSAVPSRGRTTR